MSRTNFTAQEAVSILMDTQAGVLTQERFPKTRVKTFADDTAMQTCLVDQRFVEALSLCRSRGKTAYEKQRKGLLSANLLLKKAELRELITQLKKTQENVENELETSGLQGIGFDEAQRTQNIEERKVAREQIAKTEKMLTKAEELYKRIGHSYGVENGTNIATARMLVSPLTTQSVTEKCKNGSVAKTFVPSETKKDKTALVETVV